MLAEELVAVPKGDAPGGDFAKGLVFSAAEGNGSPVAVPVMLVDGEFDRGFLGEIAFRNAAHLDFQFERLGFRGFGFPLDLKAITGAFLGIFAEFGLIGVAIVKAGREGGAAFEVEVLREDFVNAALRRAGMGGENKER